MVVLIRGFMIIAGAALACGFLWFVSKIICLGVKAFFAKTKDTTKSKNIKKNNKNN